MSETTAKHYGTAIVFLAFLTVALAGAWYHANAALRGASDALVASTLKPATVLLKENQALIAELQAAPYVEEGSGVLESYLVKIRRDGLAKTAQMKQKLDQLAENNSEIVALTAGYLPNAKMPDFATQSNKFRDYESTWRDRWNSVMDLFMAGGNYAAAGVPFPSGFPAAVDAEIAASR